MKKPGFIHSTAITILTVVIVIPWFLMHGSHAIANPGASEGEEVATYSQDDIDDKTVYHNFYLGGKLGLAFIFGIELNYIIQSREVNRTYFAAAIQSSLIVSSANVGGGVFLGKTGIGIGCRYHHLLWFESEKDSKIQPGYGPEVVWNGRIGSKYLINLHAGGIITKGSFFPDISFGVFLPLNK